MTPKMTTRTGMTSLLVAGCGAVGSQLAMHLATPGRSFTLVDSDRIAEENIGTSAFWPMHIGRSKAQVLGEMLYRKAGCVATVTFHYIRGFTSGALAEADLLVDAFDSLESRGFLVGLDIPTVHVGVSVDRIGSIIWDEDYKLPKQSSQNEGNPICTHDLGRPILRLTAVLAANVIEHYLETGKKNNL